MTPDAGLFIGVLSLSLAVPLAYAGHTLLGLRRKTCIPLLRTCDAAGISHLVIRTIPSFSHSPAQRRFLVGFDEQRPITEAADLMELHGTRHLAVFKRGAIVGILSVRDLLHPVAIDEF